ncbi:MAG TPA: methionyl-tRNA formyltransferase, partial [Woeseiaceae bacterium]|nr:methionyl-tRNA formyltransferase [Woeseiaceae bacterium]
DLPRRGCVNVHASLLPRWRGAAPVQAAILAGDRHTGISLMQMDAGLDSGPVYAQAALAIGAQETGGELHDRLARLGGELLVETLPALLEGRLTALPQDAAGVTYAAKITAADAVLDWRQPAPQLARAVRAYNPVPGARFLLDGAPVKCWRALQVAGGGAPAGTVLGATDDGIDVACGEGVLRLVELQRAGRRPVSAGEFARQAPLLGRCLATAAP